MRPTDRAKKIGNIIRSIRRNDGIKTEAEEVYIQELELELAKEGFELLPSAKGRLTLHAIKPSEDGFQD